MYVSTLQPCRQQQETDELFRYCKTLLSQEDSMIFLRKQDVCNKRRKEIEGVSRSVMSDSFATPWTVAPQSPLSMGFSRQEYWNGSPFHSPGDLHDPGMKSRSLALQADSLPSEPLQ